MRKAATQTTFVKLQWKRARLQPAAIVSITSEGAAWSANEGPRLRLFLLKPLDDSAEDWQGSSYCGPVYVESFDAEEARHLAGQYFAVQSGPGDQTIYRPWWSHSLVQVLEVDGLSGGPHPVVSLRTAPGAGR